MARRGRPWWIGVRAEPASIQRHGRGSHGSAARGALGHWLRIANGRIANYQVVTPTCWNASPRDGRGHYGPLEQALVGTPVRNLAEPVEVLRVIHSFDPCLSYAVHVMRPDAHEPVTVL